MNWDRLKVAQAFFAKAGVLHPEEADSAERRDEVLARQDVFYDCYMSCFTRDHLIKRLEKIVAGEIEMPEEEEVDAARYRKTYISQANDILASIQRGEYDE